jgi:hypothetical protein
VTHTCHIPDCNVGVKPELLMCLVHWKMVPKALQREVWRHYRRGQCDDKQPSAEWIAAAHAGIAAVQSKRQQKADRNASLPLL